jgi:hypothetical protein
MRAARRCGRVVIGNASMDVGAEGEDGVARLVYVASYPTHPDGEKPEPLDWIDANPMPRRFGDTTFVLDTDLWLAAEAELFDDRVLAHLRRHQRRPVSLRLLSLDPPMLLGGSDGECSCDKQGWDCSRFSSDA